MSRSEWRKRLLWPTVTTALGIIVLAGLGTWQLHRLAWKERLVDAIETRRAMPALDILPADAAPGELAFRRVHLVGSFVHDKEMYLTGRTHNGAVGLHVVTPLQLADGRTILVDRGWVPPDRAGPSLRADGSSEAPVEVDGVIRGEAERGPFTPDNRPDQNLWFTIDVAAMATFTGIELLPHVVEAGPPANPGGYPIGRVRSIELRNVHLQYALTWYALAAVLAVIYVIFLRRGR